MNVSLLGTWATLLSGWGNTDCIDPYNDTCQGGVAAAAALSRQHLFNDEPHLVIPRLDRYSRFVQIHPLGWNVNRLVLQQHFNWSLFVSTPSLLLQSDEISRRDLDGLQSDDFVNLLTNLWLPPSNPWYPYTHPIFFDDATGVAVLSVADSNQPFAAPQIEAALGVLDFIAKKNRQAGCGASTSENELLAIFNGTTDGRCWIPIIYYGDVPENLDAFVEAAVAHTNPPALIVDWDGHLPDYNIPRLLNRTWISSSQIDEYTYYQHRLTLTADGLSVANVEFIADDLTNVTVDKKDDLFASDVLFLNNLSSVAIANDPIVGNSTFMPVTRVDDYRRCMAGECELGNLFTDALRWRTKADVAFITSGGLRGLGWEAGPVTMGDLWDALPYPNLLCNGTMSGVSLFKLLNYSTSIATFEGEVTTTGSELLQVSGMRFVYNTALQTSRLVAVDVWNSTAREYRPLQRLHLYTFATDSFLCGADDPYPELTGGNFRIAGEVPGTVTDVLHQNIVANYLTQLNTTYTVSLEGRLHNDTKAIVALDLIQTESICGGGTYWASEKQTCLSCPESHGVSFLDRKVELEIADGSSAVPVGNLVAINAENYTVDVEMKSLPYWIRILHATHNSTASTMKYDTLKKATLRSGDTLALNFEVEVMQLDPGTAVGQVSLAITSGGSYTGCTGQDAAVDVSVRVTPSQQLNYLDNVRYVGWSLAAIAILLAMYFAAWVGCNRKLRIVKTMQPIFLVTICVGIAVMASTNFPLGIDDGYASQRGCNIACMSMPWLLSMGFTVAFSALFSKLWRINRLFNTQQFRRMQVKEKDVMAPFAVMFTLNFAFLLSWTLVDPLQWERRVIANEPWNTQGRCRSSRNIGTIFAALVATVNCIALGITCWQAFKARKISSEFSESQSVSMAIFSWLQLSIVGFPVLFLISDGNPTASYFLKSGLIFAVCLSMLLFIFVPITCNVQRFRQSLKGSMRNLSSGFRSSRNKADEVEVGDSLTTNVVRPSATGRGSLYISGFLNVSPNATEAAAAAALYGESARESPTQSACEEIKSDSAEAEDATPANRVENNIASSRESPDKPLE